MTRPEILDTAKKCVCGDREQDYGTPEQNFDVIAQLWTAFKKVPFTAVDVAVFQALVKIGRVSSGHGKSDNWVDLAGYAACGGEIESSQPAPKSPYNTYLEEMGEEDVGEVDEGRYANMSDKELMDRICRGRPCPQCPIRRANNGYDMDCTELKRLFREEFRKIVTTFLTERDKAKGNT